MYWHQKASLLCTNQNRSNQLLNQVESRLAGRDTRSMTVIQAATDPRAVVIMVDYNAKVDADQVWSDVQAANTNGWIVKGFAGYSQMPDDDTEQYILLGRIDW